MRKYFDTDSWIIEAKKIHGDRYDYSQSIFKGNNNKISIICPKHGLFEQRSYYHLRGSNCKTCVDEERDRRIKTAMHPKGSYKKLKDKKRTLRQGYLTISMPFEEQLHYKKKPPKNKLGRPIDTAMEEVHHRNGIKTDNRLHNLKLVVIHHGKGHGVKDAVKYAITVLKTYAPKMLANGA